MHAFSYRLKERLLNQSIPQKTRLKLVEKVLDNVLTLSYTKDVR